MAISRKPKPADFGLNVTITLACITVPDDVIVCVSDRKLSWAGDRIQADDNAIYKTLGLSMEWKLAYACDDIDMIFPIFQRTLDLLRPLGRVDGQEIRDIVHEAYVHVLQQDFFSSRLARFGYNDLADFKVRGQADLGPVYFELMRDLSKHSINVELIIMGYNKQNQARMYGIDADARHTDYNLTKTAVIGSGYWTAQASLTRRPMNYYLYPTIYRLLEAKFCAESGTVGKRTTAILFGRDKIPAILKTEEIEEIRNAYDKTVTVDDPQEAMDFIEAIPAVQGMEGS